MYKKGAIPNQVTESHGKTPVPVIPRRTRESRNVVTNRSDIDPRTGEQQVFVPSTQPQSYPLPTYKRTRRPRHGKTSWGENEYDNTSYEPPSKGSTSYEPPSKGSTSSYDPPSTSHDKADITHKAAYTVGSNYKYETVKTEKT